MNPSACFHFRAMRSITLVTAIFFCMISNLKLLGSENRVIGSAVNPVDVTTLHGRLFAGAGGLTQLGDDPAFAQPDFDDSSWQPVNSTFSMRDHFKDRRAGVVSWRIHIKVDPADADFAVQEFNLSSAFEIYCNGHRIAEVGQVVPFRPYTFGKVTVRVPEADRKTGLLVLMLRFHTDPEDWMSQSPAFTANTLALGDYSYLEGLSQLEWLHSDLAQLLASLLGFAVAFVALALFLAQRQRAEYLWVFLTGILQGIIEPVVIMLRNHVVPKPWTSIYAVQGFFADLALLLLFQAFARKRFNRFFWIASILSLLLTYGCELLATLGAIPGPYVGPASIPGLAILFLILPYLLLRETWRGNRETGILLIPMLFWCMAIYAGAMLAVVKEIPFLRNLGTAVGKAMNSLDVGGFHLDPFVIGEFGFWLSLTFIMVLRSTQTSRQQAILEGEVAAAREVQQVILPEAVETIPGFRIESVYEPAQEVGGDFFQIIPVEEGCMLVVVGDVAGKGLPAAMLVSVLVGAVRTAAAFNHDPAEVLAQLNERLVGRTRGGFSTALAALIAANGDLTIANAGHLPPYLDGCEVDLPGALPLGITSDVSYETTVIRFEPGSRLTFYSDGVVEAQNQAGELFGFDRAKDFSTQSASAIVEAAKQFGQEDDITVVTIKRLAAVGESTAMGTSAVLAQA